MKLTHQTKGKIYVTFGGLFIVLLWAFAALWTAVDAPAYKFATAVTGGILCLFCAIVVFGVMLCDTSEKDEL